ncbi:MAG: TIGR04282 family arsenosugar biosynthesis glycosyltransferase [Thermoplasmatota archaeon]
MKDAVIIPLVRSPRKGFVKRRLAADIGDEAALELYRNMVLDLMDSIEGVEADMMIGYHPREDLDMVRDWIGKDILFIPQAGRDLGERQASLLEHAFSMKYLKAAVMISDSPDIPAGFIDDAFWTLDSRDAVLGPCHDGGYYLIGFKRESFAPGLFSGIKWSEPSVAMGMRKRILDHGLVQGDLPSWWDIDTLEDLREFRARAAESGPGNRTLSFIASSGVFDEN